MLRLKVTTKRMGLLRKKPTVSTIDVGLFRQKQSTKKVDFANEKSPGKNVGL